MNDVTVASLATEAWARRRRRARQLGERHAFARDLLQLYQALLEVQEPAFLRARDDRPEPASLATVVVGSLGDGGQTIAKLTAEHGFARGMLDFVFIDHDKAAYLRDLEHILEQGWLHRGAIAIADNVKLPGAPAYRAYMKAREGVDWRTIEHKTHLEYQTLLADLVLESEYLPVDRI